MFECAEPRGHGWNLVLHLLDAASPNKSRCRDRNALSNHPAPATKSKLTFQMLAVIPSDARNLFGLNLFGKLAPCVEQRAPLHPWMQT